MYNDYCNTILNQQDWVPFSHMIISRNKVFDIRNFVQSKSWMFEIHFLVISLHAVVRASTRMRHKTNPQACWLSNYVKQTSRVSSQCGVRLQPHKNNW